MVLGLALTAGQTAQAKSDHILIPRKHLTLRQTIKWQHRIIRHDEWVIHTGKVHRPEVIKWHHAQLEWTRRELKQSLHTLHSQSLYSSVQHQASISASVCGSCWDNVASCESHNNWSEVTGNGFYWGLQWVPSTWDIAAGNAGLPKFYWYINHHLVPTREQQILAASTLSLSNWPVCGALY